MTTSIPARAPTSIDQHVGARLRLRRCMIEMSQSELGEKLGVTFQQVQKYERGTNRVGASRLYHLAKVLEVPVTHFFEGLDEDGPTEAHDDLFEFIASPDGIAMARAFTGIQSTAQRRQLISLMRSMSTETTLTTPEASKLFNRAQTGRIAA